MGAVEDKGEKTIQTHHESITRQTALNEITLRGGKILKTESFFWNFHQKLKLPWQSIERRYDDYLAFSTSHPILIIFHLRTEGTENSAPG